MEIKKENVIKAYMAGDDNAKIMLREMFPEIDFEAEKQAEKRPVTERVKTFEDARRELGENHPLVIEWDTICEAFHDKGKEMDYNTIAYLKLRIICAALNEGWQPAFTPGEWRYNPWYNFLTKKEWDDLSEQQKKERGVLFGGSAANGALGGFVYEYSNYAPSYTPASIGSRLCFKTNELAIYAAKQFMQDWLDLCYLPNIDCKPYSESVL